jgi:hypothetical protein
VDVHAKRTNAESDRTVSRAASDVHWGLWIQALTLLGAREVVRTAANMGGRPRYPAKNVDLFRCLRATVGPTRGSRRVTRRTLPALRKTCALRSTQAGSPRATGE